MLTYPLIHPPLLRVLALAGHGTRILIADANYAHRTNVNPSAEVIHLNLRPGLIDVDSILATIITATPIEYAHVMNPDDGSAAPAADGYRRLLGDGVPVHGLDRDAFYAAARGPEMLACVASGDTRFYANILLTIGFITPASA